MRTCYDEDDVVSPCNYMYLLVCPGVHCSARRLYIACTFPFRPLMHMADTGAHEAAQLVRPAHLPAFVMLCFLYPASTTAWPRLSTLLVLSGQRTTTNTSYRGSRYIRHLVDLSAPCLEPLLDPIKIIGLGSVISRSFRTFCILLAPAHLTLFLPLPFHTLSDWVTG
jgi:hypothetical protein